MNTRTSSFEKLEISKHRTWVRLLKLPDWLKEICFHRFVLRQSKHSFRANISVMTKRVFSLGSGNVLTATVQRESAAQWEFRSILGSADYTEMNAQQKFKLFLYDTVPGFTKYEIRNCHDLKILRLNMEHATNGCKYSAIKLWTDTPVDIREASTLKCFWKKLNAYLLADQK